MIISMSAAAFGVIAGMIARAKGRGFFLWFLYGALIFPVAFVHIMLLKKTPEKTAADLKRDGYVECPFCKEPMKMTATVCPHCRREIRTL